MTFATPKSGNYQENAMKYLCLVNLAEMPDADCVAYDKAIRQSGQCIASEALQAR